MRLISAWFGTWGSIRRWGACCCTLVAVLGANPARADMQINARTLVQMGYKPDITELDLSGKDITYIDYLALKPFTNLVTLNLSHNKLTEINSLLFTEMEKLKSLDLSHNAITNLDSSVFQYLKSVERIDISNNEITYLESNLFDDLTKLIEIDFHNNKIKVFGKDCMKYLPNLEKVYAGGNPYTEQTGLSTLQGAFCETNPKCIFFDSPPNPISTPVAKGQKH